MPTKTPSTSRKLAQVEQTHCVACGCCVKVCPLEAVTILYGLYARIAPDQCVGCGKCAKVCPADLITLSPREVAP